MRRVWVVDPYVEVDLLRRALGPVGGNMVWGQLDSDPGLTVDVHHVPVVFGPDRSAEHPGPEAALCGEVGGVEHDNLEGDLHRVILAARSRHASQRVQSRSPRAPASATRVGVTRVAATSRTASQNARLKQRRGWHQATCTTASPMPATPRSRASSVTSKAS